MLKQPRNVEQSDIFLCTAKTCNSQYLEINKSFLLLMAQKELKSLQEHGQEEHL